MKYIVKSIIFIAIAISFIFSNDVDVFGFLLFMNLIIATLFIDSRNKYIRFTAIVIEIVIVTLAGVYTDYIFFIMLILIFDIIYTKNYYFGAAVVLQFIYFKIYEANVQIWALMALVGIIAYVLQKDEAAKKEYHNILDEERRTKYELELAKARFIKTNKEVEKLTEAKERNRIARDLHDNIGHSVAGILIKLQASKKVLNKDMDKGNIMLDQCVVHLQDTLQVLRDTVHNMYNYEKQSVEYIKKIVDDYKYCDAAICVSGDFSSCDDSTFEALSYVLKEALTNTAKHSKASKVNVEIVSNDYSVALSVKDNGIGCKKISESLGIRSMRDRIKALNGNIIVDGSDGMHIVCEIPLLS